MGSVAQIGLRDSEDHIHFTKSDAIRHAVDKADDAICRTCKARIFHECLGKPGPEADDDAS